MYDICIKTCQLAIKKQSVQDGQEILRPQVFCSGSHVQESKIDHKIETNV